MLRYLPATPWNVPTSSTCGPCLPASAALAAVAGNAQEVTSPPASAAAATPDMTMRGTRVPGLTAAPSVHRRIYGKTIRRPRTARQMLPAGFHHGVGLPVPETVSPQVTWAYSWNRPTLRRSGPVPNWRGREPGRGHD